jgi:SAM-dependent methyltransferase
VDQNNQYFKYLKTRSSLAKLYRSKWIYPKLDRHLHGNVLDIGCGIGDFLSYRPETVGVDINPETVNYCKGLGLNANLMQNDVLPFEVESFDGCILDNVLEHISDPEALLKEIYRVLRQNGVLIVGVPGRRGYRNDPDHKVFYDKNILVRTLECAGFKKKKILYMPLKMPFLTLIARSYCIYGIFYRK